MSKYIAFRKNNHPDFAVVFEDWISHADITIKDSTPIRAGFVEFKTNETWGRSVTLELESKETDKKLIERIMDK